MQLKSRVSLSRLLGGLLLTSAEAMAATNHVRVAEQTPNSGEYADMWKAADLVILGRAMSRRETGETVVLSDSHRTNRCPVVDTVFAVTLVFKGTPKETPLTVRHWHAPEGTNGFCWFGPHPAEFMLPPAQRDSFLPETNPPPDYLVFLLHDAKGVYVPVTGQRYGDESVLEVYNYFTKPVVRRGQQSKP